MSCPPNDTMKAFAATTASSIDWLSRRPVNAVARDALSRSAMLVLSMNSRFAAGNRSSTSPIRYSATDSVVAVEPGDAGGRCP